MQDAVLASIRRIHRQYVRYNRQVLAPYQYVGTMHMVLLYIHHHPGASQEEIACYYALDKTGIARDCKNLEALGHIRRIISPEDRRQNKLFLTETGEAFVPTLRKLADDFAETLSSGFSEAEWKVLSQFLERIETNLPPKF